MHLVAWLRGFDAPRLEALVEAARRRGVGLHPIAPCYLEPPARAGLLLGYGGVSPKEIGVAMSRLGEALRCV
jgi:GntR family transcriptional regulator/MocR family aminotransferase